MENTEYKKSVFLKKASMGHDLSSFPKEAKEDEEIVLEAIKKNHIAFQSASEKLKKNRDFVIKAIKVDITGKVLSCVDKLFCDDRMIVEMSLKINGGSLKHASDKLRNDASIVMMAVYKNGNALTHASDEIKDNRQIVEKAILNSVFAYFHISDRLKKDETLLSLIYNKSIKDYLDLLKLDKILPETNQKFKAFKNKYPDTQNFLLRQYQKYLETYKGQLKASYDDNDTKDALLKYSLDNFKYIFDLMNRETLNKLNYSYPSINNLIENRKISLIDHLLIKKTKSRKIGF